jgi:peptidoglycan/LPS O-acetylase OafA/YrhL
LRGLAVLLVFLVHYITLSEDWVSASPDWHRWTTLVRSLGNVGVDLFFVLSGYLIYGLLIKAERPFLPYLRRRVVRIYPAFAAVFAVYLLVSALLPQKSKLPEGTSDALLYIAANFLLLPGMFDIEPMIRRLVAEL